MQGGFSSACSPLAVRKGLQPVSLVGHTYNLSSEGKAKPVVTAIEDKLLTQDAVHLFWQTLHLYRVITLDGSPLIKRVVGSEASAYPFYDQFENDSFPSPDLSEMRLVFSVESNRHRFLVVVKSEMQADMKHFGPGINSIELVE